MSYKDAEQRVQTLNKEAELSGVSAKYTIEVKQVV